MERSWSFFYLAYKLWSYFRANSCELEKIKFETENSGFNLEF